MSIRFDEKGKFFTDVVSKESVPVIIQTVTHRIQGMLHVRPDERLTDEINVSEQFFAITEATIFDDGGETLYQCEFFTVNRRHIVWIIPAEQLMDKQPGGEG